ncbi:hypothetical protein DSM112329_04910 [Paraconexibacter sp. AEG42_29]|uniref:Uncharacterized protein n=1 Tax=Paraconexibacter sp. AEG42_29 TaxID=2997339 RepID=A0AAU7B2C9_9ACTN
MSRNLTGRYALRTAAVSAVAIASLAGASSANAALGGGKVPALTDRPNLVSVTPSATAITFTYDRTIDCVAANCTPGNFAVGGYSAITAVGGTSATVSGSSVRVTFAGGNPDEDSITFGRVADGTVRTQGTLGANNLADSVRVTGAEGESGTRGHTVGPDLVSAVATGGGSNFLTLTFDQDLNDDPATFDGAQVFIVKADGTTQAGIDATISIDDNVVDVEFPAGTPVTGAKSVYVDTPTGESDDFGFDTPLRSVQVGTQNQDSQAPLLASAELTGADTVTYTFDKAVATPIPANFYVITADDIAIMATSATIVGDGKLVQAQFPTDQFTEHLVSAATVSTAVRSQADPTAVSAPGGVPIGGNAGAKATGYTSAPDAVQATFSGANVVVTLDSRIAPAVTAGSFDLLADDGTVIGGTPTATPQAQGVPGPSRVNLLYNTTAVGNARAVQLLPGAVLSTSVGNYPNIVQQLGR